MKVWVGLEHMAYESYWGTPIVFFDYDKAKIWGDDQPLDDWYYREIYEAEAR